MCELKDNFRRNAVKLKARDNNGNPMSPISPHDTIVRPNEHAAAILAQVDWEMAWIKERDHHWEDGMEVSRLPTATPGSTHRKLKCISTPTCDEFGPHNLPHCIPCGPFSVYFASENFH